MIMLFKKTNLFSCLYLIAEKNLQHEGKAIMYQTTLSVLLFVLFQSSMNSLVLASKLAVSSFLWHKSQLILKSDKKLYTKKTRSVVKLKEYIAIFLHPLVMLLHDVEYGLLKMFVLQLQLYLVLKQKIRKESHFSLLFSIKACMAIIILDARTF